MLAIETQAPILEGTMFGQYGPEPPTALRVWWSVVSAVGAGAGIYHGYKRNDSVGWAILWGIFGGALPVISIPVSLIQGFGKEK